MRVTARLTLSVAKVGGWAAALMASEAAVRADGGGVAVRAAMLFAVLLAQCSRRLGVQLGGEGGGRPGCGRVESTMAVRVEGTSATEQERTNCGPSRPVGWSVRPYFAKSVQKRRIQVEVYASLLWADGSTIRSRTAPTPIVKHCRSIARAVGATANDRSPCRKMGPLEPSSLVRLVDEGGGVAAVLIMCMMMT